MAEKRPITLDDMAGITGVGAKKLKTYGNAFLSVITGEAQQLHPKRVKLAGMDAGAIYDRLLEIQAELSRGECGTEKPLSCSAAQLSKVAQLCDPSSSAVAKVLGDRRAARFGEAFLDVLREAS